MNTGEQVVVQGRYPWNSVDSVSLFGTNLFTQDSKHDIEECLHCKRSECINCLCKDKTTLAIDECEMLLNQQKTTKEICSLMHISRVTFHKYKTALAI